MLLKFLIAFFLVGAIWSIIKKDIPMLLYFLGAAILNFGVLIK